LRGYWEGEETPTAPAKGIPGGGMGETNNSGSPQMAIENASTDQYKGGKDRRGIAPSRKEKRWEKPLSFNPAERKILFRVNFRT